MTTHANRIIDPQIMNLSGGLFADAHAPASILCPEFVAAPSGAGRSVDQTLLLLSGEIFLPCPDASEAPAVAPRQDVSQPPAPSRPAARTRRAGAAVAVLLTGLLGGLAFCAGVLMGQGAAPGAADRPEVLLAAGPALEAVVASIPAPASPEPAKAAAPAASSSPPTHARGVARVARAAAPATPVAGAAEPAPAPVDAPAEREIPAPADNPAPVDAAAPAEPAAPGINTSAAATALAIAAAGAGRCVEGGDARTAVPVRVTFAPSGRVTTAAVVGGPFAGTEVGGCVARALRTATVAPFEGPGVTVRRTVQIR